MSRNGGRNLKEALLDEARALLVREGYGQLSMRRIASAVGCTATSIYIHFASKDALIHALIEEGMEQLYSSLSEAAKAAPEPRAQLESLCRTYVDFGCANPEYYEIMFSIHPTEMGRFPADKYRRGRRGLELFAECLRSLCGPAVTDDELLSSSTLVWASLHGVVSLFIAQRIDVRLDRPQLVDAAICHTCRLATVLPDVADVS